MLAECAKENKNFPVEYLKTLLNLTKENHQQLSLTIASNKDSVVTVMDQIVKATKTIVQVEMKKSEISLNSEINIIVEKLQSEIQQELKNVHKVTKDNIESMAKTVEFSNAELLKLSLKWKGREKSSYTAWRT